MSTVLTNVVNAVVNVNADSFSFSHLLKNLIAARIMKLGSTSKITAQFETITQCFFFSHYSFIYIWETSATWGLHIF